MQKTSTQETPPVRRYGWKRDLMDRRDRLFTCKLSPTVLPPVVDLRSACPSVYDQGQLGSCTANAIAAAHQFSQIKQKNLSVFNPSRLFIYYNERAMEGTVSADAGASIRDGIKSVVNLGVCTEALWPYDISQFATQPKQECYAAAVFDQALEYSAIMPYDSGAMKQCLAEGFPFVFGIAVYESFQSQHTIQTGEVTAPVDTESMIGGHAMLCVGYDDAKSAFIVRNSYGDGWGVGGYCTIPYTMFNMGYVSDLWTLRLVEEGL